MSRNHVFAFFYVALVLHLDATRICKINVIQAASFIIGWRTRHEMRQRVGPVFALFVRRRRDAIVQTSVLFGRWLQDAGALRWKGAAWEAMRQRMRGYEPQPHDRRL
jgi:hypothetical protein